MSARPRRSSARGPSPRGEGVAMQGRCYARAAGSRLIGGTNRVLTYIFGIYFQKSTGCVRASLRTPERVIVIDPGRHRDSTSPARINFAPTDGSFPVISRPSTAIPELKLILMSMLQWALRTHIHMTLCSQIVDFGCRLFL